MNTLILHPTETCQWYALVTEAEASSQLILDVDTESYLVFLLMRYSRNARWVESIIALDFLESQHSPRHRKIDMLQDIGDKSLLFSGLFPGIANKRRVSLNYFSDLGQAAYQSAGELEMNQLTKLFLQLSEKFQTLQGILRAMRSGVVGNHG